MKSAIKASAFILILLLASYAVPANAETYYFGGAKKILSPDTVTIEAGYYDTTDLTTVATQLAAGNIRSGTSIFGIIGTYVAGGTGSPTLTTTAVSNITDTTATSGGNISSDGGASVTARGVCWNTSGNPTIDDSLTTDGIGSGPFTSNLTGLTVGTTYEVRAYATNSEGTAYGDQVSFTTKASGYNIVLLLHMDGTNGSTTFVDSESIPKTVTASGNVQISTTQSKFGGASAYFDGSGYLTSDVSDDFGFGTGDFTLDFWMNSTDEVSNYTGMASNNVDIWTSGAWRIWNRGWQGNHVHFGWYTGGTQYGISSSVNINDGVWHHIAVTRSSGVVRLFIDGVVVATDDINLTIPIGVAGKPLLVGLQLSDPTPYNGYIDEFRVSKGIARWTANFTPPTAPYEF